MANIIDGRDQRILDAATEAALEVGFEWITREDVATRAGVSTGSVNTAFGTLRDLKRAVLQHAVDTAVLPIVAQGLAVKHEIALAAPASLKEAAAATLLTA